MFKMTLLALTAVVVASMAVAADAGADPGVRALAEPACHAVQTLPLGCTLRIVDANNDGSISAAELASLASPGPLIEWSPLHPPRSTGLDFKDAAVEPGSLLPLPLERDPARPLAPALLALGGLVVLLRQRPA